MVSSDEAFVHARVESVHCEDWCDGGGDTKNEDCGSHDLSVILLVIGSKLVLEVL
jgi:hypothetical protein